MIKKFICGLCKEQNRIVMTRWHLRKHIREEHRIVNEITNTKGIKGSTQQMRRNWWISEEWK